MIAATGRSAARSVALLATAVVVAATACGPVTDGFGEGSLVVTLVPTDASTSPFDRLQPDRRYPDGSRVVRLVPGSGAGAQVLSTGLAAAGAPAVSPDGRSIVFAGRADEGERWGVYEITAGDRAPHAIESGDRDCLDPAYLAGGAIVFSCVTETGAGGASDDATWSLFVGRRDGSDPERIAYGVASAFDPTPLADGRILFAMRRLGDPGDAPASDLFTVNPDGTLFEAFGDNHGEPAFRYRPRQTDAGDVVLLSTGPQRGSPRLLRLELTQPRSPEPVLDADRELTTLSAEPDADGLLMVARDGSRLEVARLRGSALSPADLGGLDGLAPVEVVAVRVDTPPRGRPRNVNADQETGYLVGYSASRSDEIVGPPQGSPAPHTLRFQTAKAGRTPTLVVQNAFRDDATEATAAAVDAGRDPAVADDGSFFLEVPADVPLRVTTLDATGSAIATSGWFWVRPGETRACFGCHEGHAAAPINRRIEAIAQPPVKLEELIDAVRSRQVASAAEQGER